MKTEVAEFGAGCFWGTEATFRKVPGVIEVQVGYEGGSYDNPTYEDVCGGRTGHAEVVKVVYDSSKVDYRQLVDVFFENHDPTTLNRQGPDVGAQYRSVIFYHSPDQRRAAEEERERRNRGGEYVSPIVTAIEPAKTFYAAEDYHQRYFEKHGVDYACHLGNGKRRSAR